MKKLENNFALIGTLRLAGNAPMIPMGLKLGSSWLAAGGVIAVVGCGVWIASKTLPNIDTGKMQRYGFYLATAAGICFVAAGTPIVGDPKQLAAIGVAGGLAASSGVTGIAGNYKLSGSISAIPPLFLLLQAAQTSFNALQGHTSPEAAIWSAIAGGASLAASILVWRSKPLPAQQPR